MNLQLNAIQKREIESAIDKSGLDPAEFEYFEQPSELVSVYVRHTYRALSGDEPAVAEGIRLRAEPEYGFTFERDARGTFMTTCFPELELGPMLKARAWQGLLKAFSDWLEVLKVQIEDEGVGPALSPTFAELIESKNMLEIEREFRRAEDNCRADPPAAAAAACAMLESACKLYIEDHCLDLPVKSTVKPLWNVVRHHLLDSADGLGSDDVQRLLGGLTSVVDGVGALRTHGSSAHGRGRNEHSIDTPEALLAVHASQSVVLYLLTKWE